MRTVQIQLPTTQLQVVTFWLFISICGIFACFSPHFKEIKISVKKICKRGKGVGIYRGFTHAVCIDYIISLLHKLFPCSHKLLKFQKLLYHRISLKIPGPRGIVRLHQPGRAADYKFFAENIETNFTWIDNCPMLTNRVGSLKSKCH